MINENILMIIDSVAREKTLEREDIFQAVEMALSRAAEENYGKGQDIRATMDRTTGKVTLKRYKEVVAEIEFAEKQMTEAEGAKHGLALGEFWSEELPMVDSGRIAAYASKQVIVQKIREAERLRQYEEYKDKVGEIVLGTVKREDYGNLILDINRAEAILRKDEIIRKQRHKIGERVRAYIYDVKRELKGPQIFLSRTHPDFMKALFKQEVPEIYDGVIEVMAVARDPGSRAKIIVRSKAPNIDPVGTCIGMKGSRVQQVTKELFGEKIDIIHHTDDQRALLIEAMAPAAVQRVVIDDVEKNAKIIVDNSDEKQLGMAIGSGGQNVRLASILTGFDIDILTTEDFNKQQEEQTMAIVNLFKEALDVDDILARLLYTEGYKAVEEVALVDPEELMKTEGIDADIAQELQLRGKAYLTKHEKEVEQQLDALGVDKDIRKIDGLSRDMIMKLAAQDIKTIKDFAYLDADELCGYKDGILKDFSIKRDTANQLIMTAREMAGLIEKAS
ncbi:MAG: transcription termination factor NusA [Hydrotalea sp.]|nr:transcription termination factor NusA [Hydrotalea sp.]